MTAAASEVPVGICTYCVSRTGCVLVALRDFGGLSATSRAFVLGSCMRGKAKMATGFECHETTFRSLGEMTRVMRSMNVALIDKIATTLETTPNKTEVSR